MNEKEYITRLEALNTDLFKLVERLQKTVTTYETIAFEIKNSVEGTQPLPTNNI